MKQIMTKSMLTIAFLLSLFFAFTASQSQAASYHHSTVSHTSHASTRKLTFLSSNIHVYPSFKKQFKYSKLTHQMKLIPAIKPLHHSTIKLGPFHNIRFHKIKAKYYHLTTPHNNGKVSTTAAIKQIKAPHLSFTFFHAKAPKQYHHSYSTKSYHISYHPVSYHISGYHNITLHNTYSVHFAPVHVTPIHHSFHVSIFHAYKPHFIHTTLHVTFHYSHRL